MASWCWSSRTATARACSASPPTGGVTSWLPLFLFVILFGLSMDYHVFILSRVREAYQGGMSTAEAVRHGISTTAGTVTSAAVVMVVVFSVFVTLSFLDFKEMGVGLGGGRPDRRDDRARRPAAGVDEGARRLELVPAEVARVDSARARHRAAQCRGSARAGRGTRDHRVEASRPPPRTTAASIPSRRVRARA